MNIPWDYLSLSFLLAFAFKHFQWKMSIPFILIFNFPGTFFHELMHLIFGLVANGKPTKFSLIPKVEGDSITFGYVSFVNLNNFNAFPISMAPLILLGFPIITSYFLNIYEFEFYQVAGLTVLTALVCHSAIPSTQDFKIAISHPVGSMAWLGLIYFFLSSVFEYEIEYAKQFTLFYFDQINLYFNS